MTRYNETEYRWENEVANTSTPSADGVFYYNGVDRMALSVPDLDLVFRHEAPSEWTAGENTFNADMYGPAVEWEGSPIMPGQAKTFVFYTPLLQIGYGDTYASSPDGPAPAEAGADGGGIRPGNPIIRSVSWLETGTAEGGPLDAQPAGTPGGGMRIFAERKKYTDTVVAEQVKVRVQLTAPKAGVPVALRLVDVDDPSDYAAPVDDESTDADNRSAVSAAGGIVAMSEAQGVVTWNVSVSHRPGDNYRAVASVESMDLSWWVADKASGGKLAQAYRTGPLGN